MLKACFQCLAGEQSNGAQVEESNNIQLNGQNVHKAPPWPLPQLTNEKMFLLPKVLATHDQINVEGETNLQQTLSIGLVTGGYSGHDAADYQNVACQVDVNFATDQISIKIVEHGNNIILNGDNRATDYFVESKFRVGFLMREWGRLTVVVGDSELESVSLKHSIESIRYLSVHGDVNRVSRIDFQFGQ